MVQERALPAFSTNLAEISSEVGLRLYEDMILGTLFRGQMRRNVLPR